MKGKHIMAKKGLGKGIDVLIPQAKEKTKSEKENIKTKEVIKEVVKEVIKEVDTIDINKIEPNKNQPRKSFDEDSIHELTLSSNLRSLSELVIATLLFDTFSATSSCLRLYSFISCSYVSASSMGFKSSL